MNTYRRLDIAFVHGEGAWLTDAQGHRYLDALSGLAVTGLGHANPEITKVIQQQAETLLHTSNLYHIPEQTELAKRLVDISGMDNAFFANSGAEANECAIKISRLYGTQKGLTDPTIIVADAAFHGRTMATLTATGNAKIQAGFAPLMSGFVRVPFNHIEAIQQIAENNQQIIAILIEPIQGEGGIQIPNDHYLSQLRHLCDAHDWFLILDEIQTGNGRTGTYFTYQQSGILPDLLTTAKGLGNGIPIGVCLAKGKAANVFQPGHHGSTFGGNPLACAVANQVVQHIEDKQLSQRAKALGEQMLSQFKTRLEHLNSVKDIRGKGLMLAIELNAPCGELVNQAMAKGLLLNVTADSVIRLLPPLIISDAEADQIVDTVCSLVGLS